MFFFCKYKKQWKIISANLSEEHKFSLECSYSFVYISLFVNCLELQYFLYCILICMCIIAQPRLSLHFAAGGGADIRDVYGPGGAPSILEGRNTIIHD